ncbi:MAG: bifunctional diaminohydroxyphosphoribosylaminopyrimidine deaminase/5-amino-6-(5-phosphoribosylamino)uracil reductase RibD [Candidatus Hydrothermae bacterium]|nr:bifunctional diaminohydroxyphosphoribosylaminopyrimidine deaminase/5-amino-6-(5-phosphoribosylamino)uracil reductase RibD [Candidatus Hydrothermae bacterium]
MRVALDLAELGRGFTSPNPLVGAVVVQRGERVVGVGYHKRKGEAHAEVRALEDARGHTQGATLYVTLEPHNFHGSTPPCTRAIREAGIARVVVATLDPNPRVNGKGLQELRDAGMDTVLAILEDEAREQNRYYFTYVEQGRPYVILKLALTADGRIAPPDRRPMAITGEEARARVHRLRGEVEAVLVGAGTGRSDDPLLTPREVYPARIPLRVVVGGGAELIQARVFRSEPTTLWYTPQGEGLDLPDHVQPVPLPRKEDGSLDWIAVLRDLAGTHGVQSLLVEGGARVAASLLQENLVDELWLFYAPWTLGEGLPGLPASLDLSVSWTRVETAPVGRDWLVRFRKTKEVGG